MKISRIYYNWHHGDICEECSYYEVGVMALNGRTPNKIIKHQGGVEGDELYYTVHFKNGKRARIFDLNAIIYE